MADALGVVALAALDQHALHVPEALACGAIGAIVAAVRRFVPRVGVRVVAAPIGAMAAGLLAAIAAARGAALPIIVAIVALAGAVVALAIGARDREVHPLASSAIWLLAATIAWIVYLSVPDTEGAVAALGVAGPVALVASLAPTRTPAVAVGTEVGALLVLLAGALVLGGAGSFTLTGWWVAKLVGAVGAVLLFGLGALLVRRTTDKA